MPSYGTGKEPAGAPAKEFSLGTIFDLLRKHRLCVIVTPLLVTLGFVIYAVKEPTRYSAEALLADQPTTVEGYVNKGSAPPINVREKLWLVRENLLSPTVLEPLIQDFHLESREDAGSQIQFGMESALRRIPFLGSGNKTGGMTEQNQGEPPIEELKKIEDLKKKITIQVEAADAFSIGFEGDDRKQAMDVANRLADLLVQRTSAASEQSASSAADFLKDEAERVKQKLDRQNELIRNYQQHTANALPTRLANDLKFLEGLQEQVHLKSDQISNEQARRTGILQEIQDLENRGTAETPAKSEDEAKLDELRLKLKQLQTTYTDQHPEIRQTQSEMRNLEKSIAENKGSIKKSVVEPSPAQLRLMELKGEVQAIEQRLSGYQKQQKELSAEMASYQQKAESAPESERTLADLTKDADAARTEYQSILQKQNQAQLEERLNKLDQGSVFRIVRRASAPLIPSGPHRARIVLMGLVAGFGLGMALAFFGELRDTSYENADEFQSSSSLPVLTVIPSLSFYKPSRPRPVKQIAALSLKVGTSQAEQTALPTEAVVTMNDPRSIAAEQYGILAMEVRQRLGRDSSKVLAVTSPAGGEGKTITSLNLSIALSRTMEGQVLLVECDLRKPRLHEYLSFQPGKGFSDLLQKPDDPIDDYLRRLNGLSFIPGGPILEDPLRFLASPRTQHIFTRLRQNFQFIVVDTPPIVPIADSHILSGLADGVVLVVRARNTRRELLNHALQSFHAPNILGVVLNGVDLRQSRYYYAYDYYSEQYIGGEKRKRA